MSVFWLIIVAMLLVALLFINWPWCKRAQSQTTPLRAGQILLLVGMNLLFVIVALGLYLYWGHSQQLSGYYQAKQQAQRVQQELQQIGTPQQVIAKLEERLHQQPDAKGWYLLGRLYFSQGQLKQAIEAYARANQLQPEEPQFMLAYAEALLLSAPANSTQAKDLLNRVLMKQQDTPEALNLLAIIAYQQADYQQAISYWEQLLARFSTSTEEGQQLLAAIAKAQAALQQSAPSKTKISIPVQVQIAENIAEQLAPTDTVFIYAQAAQGPKMPLAIMRKQVKDLPLKVVLDESMAMLPALSLANFKEIRLIARVSKSGQAIAQADDWFGESGVFVTTQVPPNLVISIKQRWQEASST